jgi:hypothetical protein
MPKQGSRPSAKAKAAAKAASVKAAAVRQKAVRAAACLPVAADAAASTAGPTLVEKGEERKRRRLERRATAEQTERALADHFPGFSPHQVDILQVEGLTLRQRLTKDVHERNVKGKSARLSSSYWQQMHAMYTEASTSAVASNDPYHMSEGDKTLEVRPCLVQALTAARAANTTVRSKAALQTMLDSVEDFNKRELIGISRHMVGTCSS